MNNEGTTFINEIDEDKFKDFLNLSKEDFLNSYSYLTKEDYDKTKDDYDCYVHGKVYELGIIIDGCFVPNKDKRFTFEEVCLIKEYMQQYKKRKNNIINRQKINCNKVKNE